MDDGDAEFFGSALEKEVSQFEGRRVVVDSVGKVFEAVAVSADADFAFDAVVVGGHVGVVDGPVGSGSVDGVALEIAVAQAQGYSVPEHGLATDSPGSLGAHAGFARLHGGDVAVGEVEGQGVGVEVGAGVDGGAAFYDGDVYAASGEMGG